VPASVEHILSENTFYSQVDFAAAAGACQIFSKVSALVYLPKLNQTKVNPARYSRKSAPSYIY
jgi:hypothetical protein